MTTVCVQDIKPDHITTLACPYNLYNQFYPVPAEQAIYGSELNISVKTLKTLNIDATLSFRDEFCICIVSSKKNPRWEDS